MGVIGTIEHESKRGSSRCILNLVVNSANSGRAVVGIRRGAGLETSKNRVLIFSSFFLRMSAWQVVGMGGSSVGVGGSGVGVGGSGVGMERKQDTVYRVVHHRRNSDSSKESIQEM